MRKSQVNDALSRRAALATGAIGLLSLLAAFAMLLTPGDELSVRSSENDSYSRSAVGHFGIVHLLRDLGRDVRQCRMVVGNQQGLLVLAEPAADVTADELRRRIDSATVTLVVLPKRGSHEDQSNPGWVDYAGPDDDRGDGTLRALAEAKTWPEDCKTTILPQPAFDSAIDLPQPKLVDAQLMTGLDSSVTRIVVAGAATLLARYGNVYVLSDPDVIANHGLADNAAFAVAMFDLASTRGPIAFDETIHGKERQPSMWHALGSYPLVLVPVHLLLMLALTLWIAHGRFGAPAAAPRAIAAGKAFLIDNIAALLNTGRELGPALVRHGAMRAHATARRLRAPATLAARDAGDWLCSHVRSAATADAVRAALTTIADTSATDRERLTAAHELHRLLEELR